MGTVILGFIQDLLGAAAEILTTLFLGLANIAFYPERQMRSLFDRVSEDVLGNPSWVDGLYLSLIGIGLALVLLKFLRKGFDVYMAWTDGDPDTDPLSLVVNLLRAVAMAVGFPMLYGVMVTITKEIIRVIMEAIIGSGLDWTSFILQMVDGIVRGHLAVMTLPAAILTLVYIIALILLMLQYMGRGLEMLILRLGMPFACVGLIDSDRGVYAPYMRKFFQNMATVVVQLALMELSIVIFLRGHSIWSLAMILLAIRTPRFLQEFMLLYGFGNPSSALYLFTQLRGILSRPTGVGGTVATPPTPVATGTAPAAAAVPPPPPVPPV